jgi:4-methyl-5(b-hydroxyethyl)-thiazole monophosphate biosynthesis
MKRACVLLAEGFEEVEAVTPIDYLRRAGIDVRVLGVGGISIRGAHDIVVQADVPLGPGDAEVAWDAVVVPGGGVGSKNIAANADAVALIRAQAVSGRLVAAICAAPAVVLHKACGILAGRRWTGYPGTELNLTGAKVSGATFVAERVVDDGNLITARAAGCAGEFSVAIARSLLGEVAGNEVAGKVLL